jgi:O-antigen ligase
LSSGAVTALFFAYGTAGILGTLIGGPLVARKQVGTFALAALGVGVALITLPLLGIVPITVSIAPRSQRLGTPDSRRESNPAPGYHVSAGQRHGRRKAARPL